MFSYGLAEASQTGHALISCVLHCKHLSRLDPGPATLGYSIVGQR